jgi:hypothetical protein
VGPTTGLVKHGILTKEACSIMAEGGGLVWLFRTRAQSRCLVVRAYTKSWLGPGCTDDTSWAYSNKNKKNELGLKKTVKFLTLNPKSRESCVIKSNNFSRNWTTINSSRKHKFVATTTVPHSQSTSYNPTNNDNCHNASELNEKGCQKIRS